MSELLKRLRKLMEVDIGALGVKEIPEKVQKALDCLEDDIEAVEHDDERIAVLAEKDAEKIEEWLAEVKPISKKVPSTPDDVAKSFKDADFKQDDFFDKTVCNFIIQFQGADRESARVLAITLAKKCGITGFAGIFKRYREEIEPKPTEPTPFFFADSPLQEKIDPGDWKTNGQEIWKEEDGRKRYACKHPIIPIAELTNIDNGSVKTQLAYKRNGYWETAVVPNEILSTANRISSALPRIGISVVPSTAANLPEYIEEIKLNNRELMPRKSSISRLGWMGEKYGFVPYTDQVIFDDEIGFHDMIEALKPEGTFEAWKDAANQLRTSTEMQIILAASFASVLMNIVRGQTFFCHIWSPISGSGKTVAMKLAASVWANPNKGYIRNFSGTSVSFELTAGFLNHLPLIVDELQLGNQDGNKKRFDVYALAEGFGKSRGTKGLGVQTMRTWQNVIITSGETPIADSSSASGVINRIIDVQIEPYKSIIDDNTVGNLCKALEENYGHAGRRFVEAVYPIRDAVRHRYDELCEALRHGATGKQANAGAAIILADELMNGFIFESEPTLTVEVMSGYLAGNQDADVAERAYQYMQSELVQKSNCIEREGGVSADRTLPETIGRFSDEEGYVYIVKSEFERMLKRGEFDPKAVISAMVEKKQIRVTPGRLKERKYTVPHNVGIGKPECYCFLIGKKSDDSQSASNGATFDNQQKRFENCKESEEIPF